MDTLTYSFGYTSLSVIEEWAGEEVKAVVASDLNSG